LTVTLQRGVGASILSLSAVTEELRSGSVSICRIVSPAIDRTVNLCTLKGRPVTFAAAAVQQRLRRVVDDLIESGAGPCRPAPDTIGLTGQLANER
jgi:hypothetical protein